MDEYIDARPISGRIRTHILVTDGKFGDISPYYKFLYKCEKNEEFLDYYVRSRFVEFTGVLGIIAYCFRCCPKVFKCLTEISASKFEYINVKIIGSLYYFDIMMHGFSEFDDVDTLDNIKSVLRKLDFVYKEDTDAWVLYSKNIK